ncbi:MAG: DUF2306 domain-containing protein [Pleurocapsa sp. SU_196_0]|nr:DUF2306 domain-containing protein [Pleurocapsa sp. SU_196_0]
MNTDSTLTLKKWSGPKKFGWFTMLFLSFALFVLSGSYLSLNPDVFFERQKAVYVAHPAAIWLHVAGSMLAMIIGPVLFLPVTRKARWLGLHRWMGRFYLLGVVIGACAGLYLSQLAHGGLIARLGFNTLGWLWLFTAAMAYVHIRNKNIPLHREWMKRNFAMTFGAVTLRLWLGVFGMFDLEFTRAYAIVAWLSWIPNLLIIEWTLHQTRPATTRLQPSTLTARDSA